MKWKFILWFCVMSRVSCASSDMSATTAVKEVASDGEASQNLGERSAEKKAASASEFTAWKADPAELESIFRFVRGIMDDMSGSSQKRRQPEAAETKVSASEEGGSILSPIDILNQDIYENPASKRVGRKIVTSYLPDIFNKENDESLFTLMQKFKKSVSASVDPEKDLKSVLGRSIVNFIMPNQNSDKLGKLDKLNMGSSLQLISAIYKTLTSLMR